VKVAAESLELRRHGDQVGGVQLPGQVLPARAIAADLSVRVLELIEFCP
jgi:hypothetical protein